MVLPSINQRFVPERQIDNPQIGGYIQMIGRRVLIFGSAAFSPE
jgi:hypothetical protein